MFSNALALRCLQFIFMMSDSVIVQMMFKSLVFGIKFWHSSHKFDLVLAV